MALNLYFSVGYCNPCNQVSHWRFTCFNSLLHPPGTMAEKIINYNKRLFGPGPLARVPAPGIRGYYARMPPLQGFTMAAVHGVTMGLGVSLYYKFFMGDPDTRTIKQYYEENPPR
mmetsp:Transcript_20970/g.51517  ORF Transcript_20970/g.51517 Transcript_20970/m.51517 type:complete len:115 (+) Transcript_20970:146-490(+)